MERDLISVLQVTNTPVRSGVEEHILALLQGLDRKRFCLRLVCPPALAEQMRPDVPTDVELTTLPVAGSARWTAVRRLAQILREVPVDILHSHMFQTSRLASPVGFFRRVPVVVETPHVREQWRSGWLKNSFILDRLVGRFVDYYIAVSQANARYLTEQKGLPKAKIVVIHNGTHLARFQPSRSAPEGMKRSLGFDEADPILVVLARLEPQKGHHVLLEALPAVQREFPRARLVCAGDGALRAELENRARDLGLQPSVRFVGYQTNPADWLALADVVVLPSYYEGLPIIAIEALAAGKAMVATAVDGTPEVVLDDKTGLTVPPGEPLAMAGAICRLLRDKELRNRFGSTGRSWVLENFTQEQQVIKTQEFYLAALKHCRHKKIVRAWNLTPKLEERSPTPKPAGTRRLG
jgi:glycosyltransferase involved in cell wall biosynthesis